MLSIFSELDGQFNHTSKFWAKPDKFSSDDYPKKILHTSSLNFLCPGNSIKTCSVSVTPTRLYYSKSSNGKLRMSVITWKILDTFYETNGLEERYGFRLYQNYSFQDFFSSSKSTIDKWIEVLSKFTILVDFEDSFSIIKEIGCGNYSTVFLALDLCDKKQYAVKSIRKDLIASRINFDSLISEICIMREIKHENIVKLHKVYEGHEHVHLVLEYVQGGDFLSRISKFSTFSESEVAIFMKSFLKTLDYLHGNKIIHRDIKPDNILLSSESCIHEFKIGDFGLACHEQENLTNRCGSPGYIAPEILKNYEYTEKIDIFSTGIIFYILLSGKTPFFGKTQQEILMRNRQCKIYFQDRYWSHVSKEGIDLVLRLTESDPTKRPSAKEALQHPWFETNHRKDAKTISLQAQSFNECKVSAELMFRMISKENNVNEEKPEKRGKNIFLDGNNAKMVLRRLRSDDMEVIYDSQQV